MSRLWGIRHLRWWYWSRQRQRWWLDMTHYYKRYRVLTEAPSEEGYLDAIWRGEA